jgi:hypothetical protein
MIVRQFPARRQSVRLPPGEHLAEDRRKKYSRSRAQSAWRMNPNIWIVLAGHLYTFRPRESRSRSGRFRVRVPVVLSALRLPPAFPDRAGHPPAAYRRIDRSGLRIGVTGGIKSQPGCHGYRIV